MLKVARKKIWATFDEGKRLLGRNTSGKHKKRHYACVEKMGAIPL